MIYFSSDHHFGHRNVIVYCKRPFTKNVAALQVPLNTPNITHDVQNSAKVDPDSLKKAIDEDVKEMNETMIRIWNETVKPEDTVYYLGDFSLSFEQAKPIISQLNGTKHLISGNHDLCSRLHPKSRNPGNQKLWIQKYIDAGFVSVKESDILEIEGQKILLHHLPYKNLEPGAHGEKYHKSRPDNEGLILLHGHVHNAWLKRSNMINVGVDRHNFTPVRLTEIAELITKKEDI